MNRVLSAVAFTIVLFSLSCKSNTEVKTTEADENPELVEETTFYGFDEDDFDILHDTIGNNQFLSDILLPHHINYTEIDGIAKNAKEVFDVRHMKAGRPIHLVCKKDSLGKAVCLIYEQDPVHYVTFHLGDSLYATKGEKEVTVVEEEASGTISSSLFLTITEQDLSPALAMEMADIFAWTIDFYRLQKGDNFKIIYEKQMVENNFVGIGEVKSVLFEHSGEDFYAFRFLQDSVPKFFDDKGQGLRKAFLKSPLKFGRLTSKYTMRRFHPVQKRNKPHLGTDYAAATGTPILATGDGTVIASSRNGGNGNFVKIRHNNTFSTQYLHMSKRGVKVGDFVHQGDVIGYVGSTGLATGPHVCYRFWKNGKQVDHLREKFEPSEPLPEDQMATFEKVKLNMKSQLDAIQIKGEIVEEQGVVQIPTH